MTSDPRLEPDMREKWHLPSPKGQVKVFLSGATSHARQLKHHLGLLPLLAVWSASLRQGYACREGVMKLSVVSAKARGVEGETDPEDKRLLVVPTFRMVAHKPSSPLRQKDRKAHRKPQKTFATP